MIGGGGVDGAVHRAGGPAIMKELAPLRAKGGCPTGGAVLTSGGALPVRWVIHAVGPIWRGGDLGEPARLEGAYVSALARAEEKACVRVTFPSLSTGAYGYPVEQAAPIALAAVSRGLRRSATLREASFVLFDRGTLLAYARALARLSR